jgi:hypothetical protein
MEQIDIRSIDKIIDGELWSLHILSLPHRRNMAVLSNKNKQNANVLNKGKIMFKSPD